MTAGGEKRMLFGFISKTSGDNDGCKWDYGNSKCIQTERHHEINWLKSCVYHYQTNNTSSATMEHWSLGCTNSNYVSYIRITTSVGLTAWLGLARQILHQYSEMWLRIECSSTAHGCAHCHCQTQPIVTTPHTGRHANTHHCNTSK